MGAGRGAFTRLADYAMRDPPTGRTVIIPVRGCRMTRESWTSARGTGVTGVKMHLAQAPGAARVGLVIMEGVPLWGNMDADQGDRVLSALDSALPNTINWDADWLDLEVGIDSPARCLALFAETTEAGRAIRALLKPVDVEEGAFAVGGVWDEVGRPIPVLLQPAGVRDEKEGEWARRACLYTLDTIFRSWSTRRAVSVGLDSVAEFDATWQGLEHRLGITLRRSGYKGEKVASLTGVLDAYSYRTPSGGIRIWLTVIGSAPAEALIRDLQAGRREADEAWKIKTVTTEEAYAEGARRWGPLYRKRHTAPNAVKGVWGRPPALAWAMAANGPPAKIPSQLPSGSRGGGATDRQVGVQSSPSQSAWAPLTPPLTQTASSEHMGAGGRGPDGRLDAIAADVAGLKLGQTRLTTRVDDIQATQAVMTSSLRELAAKQAAESAREASLAKASNHAIDRLAALMLQAGQPRGRLGRGRAADDLPAAGATMETEGAPPSADDLPAAGAAMETERAPSVVGIRRSLSPERTGSVTRQRVGRSQGNGTGAGETRGVEGVDNFSPFV